MKDKIPGIETEQDLHQVIKSLQSGIYWSRRSGRFASADLFEETLNAIFQNHPKLN